MERKIVKVVSFDVVHDDYSFDIDIEYVDFGNGKLQKYYWLVDNFNHVKVCVWTDRATNITYEEEKVSKSYFYDRSLKYLYTLHLIMRQRV